jgi:hypothetical protein
MLVDIVIVDPTRTDLVSREALSCEVVGAIAAQAKDGFYCDQYSANWFLLLAIEVFGCLH